MKSLLLLLTLFIFTSCQTSQKQTDHQYVSEQPDWVSKLNVENNYPEAQVKELSVYEFDKNIFKFKDELKNTATVSYERKPVDNNSKAIHLVINNGNQETSPQPPKKLNLSLIERNYHELMGISGGKAVRQFGYAELMNNKPDENAPVDDDYIIGPGDKINLKVTGSVKIDEILTVNHNGSIFLPERIGAVQLYGVRKSNLKNVISQSIGKEYINYKLEASLSDLRSIRVLLTGKVVSPGLKSLRPGSTLIDALALAGGVHKDGSLRQLIIKKKNSDEITIDLYNLLFKGEQNLDIPLQSGDQILVPPIGKTICIIGMMGQGIYEIKNETLSSLLSIHGKLNAFTSKDRVLLEKTVNQKGREIYSLTTKEANLLTLEDGYVIDFQGIREQLDNTVELVGQMTRTGKYPWTPGMTVRDLLNKGEGFLMNAALNKAMIRRRVSGEVHYEQAARMGVTRVREELIWIPVDKILSGDSESNIPLQKFDTLRILSITDFQDTPQVEILGAVRKPGKYNLTQRMTLGDLVALAGNPASEAYPGNGVIVRKVYNEAKNCFDVKMFHFNVAEVMKNLKASYVTLEQADQVIVRTAASESVKVQIKGEVQFPGSYILPADSKITDLIKAAGGLLNKADLRAAEFLRESIRKQQESRLDELFEKTRQRLSRSRSYITRDGRIQESYASTMELRSLQNLKNEMFQRQIKGRVVLDFLQDSYPSSLDNLILEENDVLFIPQKMNSVMVMGHVYSPNAFVWRKDMTVEDYLKMSGGYREEAGEDEVYLVLASGQVKSAKQIGHGKLMEIVPSPGDTLLIPKQEMDRSGMAVASDYLRLFRQAAELGAITHSIPYTKDTQIGINSDITTRDVTGGSYTPLLK